MMFFWRYLENLVQLRIGGIHEVNYPTHTHTNKGRGGDKVSAGCWIL